LFENSSNLGISILHGAHHVAQKFSNTTLTLYAVRLIGFPPASLRTKEGAEWPAGSGAAWALLNDETHKQRAMTYFNFMLQTLPVSVRDGSSVNHRGQLSFDELLYAIRARNTELHWG
jgi:hypothetical protein